MNLSTDPEIDKQFCRILEDLVTEKQTKEWRKLIFMILDTIFMPRIISDSTGRFFERKLLDWWTKVQLFSQNTHTEK